MIKTTFIKTTNTYNPVIPPPQYMKVKGRRMSRNFVDATDQVYIDHFYFGDYGASTRRGGGQNPPWAP